MKTRNPSRSSARRSNAPTSQTTPLWQRQGVRTLLAVCGLTLVLVAWKWDVLDSPPYYDFASGLFVEANYLVETDFDYASLSQRPAWFAGGEKVYLTSILPTMLAILMKALPTARGAIIAWHVFNIACAAIVAVLIYKLLVPHAGRTGACLTAAVWLTVPLISVQVEMAGMEMPMAAAAMAATYFLTRGNYVTAALLASLAHWTKASGLSIIVAGGVLLGLMTLLGLLTVGRRREARRAGMGLAAFAIVLLLAIVVEKTIGTLTNNPEGMAFAQSLDWWTKATMTVANVPWWCPDQVLIFALVSVAAIGLGAVWFRRRWRETPVDSPLQRASAILYEGLLRMPFAVLAPIIIGGFCVAMMQWDGMPRYLVLPVCFLYLVFGLVLFGHASVRRFAAAACAALIVVNLVNADGRWFPDLSDRGRTGSVLERSREYLDDHRSNIEAMRTLAAEYPSVPVIAGVPYVHYLGLPRLGVVERPLRGYSLNRYTPPTFQSAMRLPYDKPREVVLVSVTSSLIPPGVVPPPEPGERIIYNDSDRNKSPLIVYLRRWPSELSDQQLASWYRGMVWQRTDLAGRFRLLLEEGQRDDAIALARQWLEQDPSNAVLHLATAEQLEEAQRFEEALVHARRAGELAPEELLPRLRTGLLLRRLGRLDEAAEELRGAIRLHSEAAEPHHALAMVLADQGRLDDAERHFRRAVELAPTNVEFRWNLGKLLILQGKIGEAVRSYRQTLGLDPDAYYVANDLAWLLATHPDENIRDGAEAVRLAEQARAGIDRSDPLVLSGVLDTLAASYAEAGRFDDAVQTASEAIELARATEFDELANGLEQRRQQYRAGQPYRDVPAGP